MRIDDAAILERAASPRFKGFDGFCDGKLIGTGSDCEGAHLNEEGCDGLLIVSSEGDNPFCGDSIEIRLALRRMPQNGASKVSEFVVEEAAFEGYACTLCCACSDCLMEMVRGMPLSQVRLLSLDELLAFWGGLEVGRTRKGCVELPLMVLRRALASSSWLGSL